MSEVLAGGIKAIEVRQFLLLFCFKDDGAICMLWGRLL